MRAGGSPVLGIVIPTLDEGERLPLLLEDLDRLEVEHRTVVADGGSQDDTVLRATEGGARVIHAPRGRAAQMNVGALAVDTSWLLFVHADSRVPPRTGACLGRWLEHASPRTAGHFRFSLEGEDPFWRFLEFGQALRERTSGLAYGDQGLVVSRELFREVGGFPDQPLMEDVEILRRIRRTGRVERIEAPLPTSPRRYRREGRWRGWLRNLSLISLYLAGVPATRLAAWYPSGNGSADGGLPRTRSPGRHRSPHGEGVRGGGRRGRRQPGSGRRSGGSRDHTLLVFAKVPEEGRVKTRLAAEVGVSRATRVYRTLGRRVIEQLRGGRYRTVVCHDPPDGGSAIRAWLGDRVEVRPQVEGDLGRRMEEALRAALDGSEAACVVGTDAPGVDRALVEEAFRALEHADVVFGPARDGGYYLVGMREVRPALFRGIPWSTSEVLARSLERAEESEIRVALLPPLADVDTAADLTADLRRDAGIDDDDLAAPLPDPASSSASFHAP